MERINLALDAGCFEVPLGFRKCGVFLEKFRKRQLLKNSAPWSYLANPSSTRVGTLIVVTIYLQLIQNRYMFRSITVLQCSHQHCVQPVASDVEVVGYL